MYLAKVLGSVVVSQKVAGVEALSLRLVQPLDELKQPHGPKQVAVDTVSSGPGDFVYLVGSREATLALENTFVPVDAAIVGIIDDMQVCEL